MIDLMKQNGDAARGMAYGGIVGGVVGGIIGTMKYRKSRKKSQEILLQIKELTSKV